VVVDGERPAGLLELVQTCLEAADVVLLALVHLPQPRGRNWRFPHAQVAQLRDREAATATLTATGGRSTALAAAALTATSRLRRCQPYRRRRHGALRPVALGVFHDGEIDVRVADAAARVAVLI